jgi:hypothetical protein
MPHPGSGRLFVNKTTITSSKTMHLSDWISVNSFLERLTTEIDAAFRVDYRDDVCRWQVTIKLSSEIYKVFVDDPEESVQELITEIKLRHC